jgi:hypothetical protein
MIDEEARDELLNLGVRSTPALVMDCATNPTLYRVQDLIFVNPYRIIGRVITQDIQKNEKRAGNGKQFLERLPY